MARVVGPEIPLSSRNRRWIGRQYSRTL